ncbi:phosphonate C-P lyase system protein PhnG [Shimia sp. Alg240-R146]|uniref:phosphonate C-P lyase system protein PhnG n=1 Tax=Shimia sp. Alg240-R146 TaxID=2993449 RepID=UPI0022E0F688|nr:phosphonate C-P lyase system protein PhnG [Shimia sp. Alg240-R146]
MTAENNRRSWMSVLAKTPAGRLLALWHELGAEPDFHWLRAPEIGATMVRGRLGGTGAPFNLGEMTLTRCALQLESGAVGHGYVQGRDKDKARVAALVDALMQTEQAEAVRAAILTPLQAEMTASKGTRAAKAAATKVDFFTMVRGED